MFGGYNIINSIIILITLTIMKYKLLALLYKHRIDFSTSEMSMNNYSEFGIREEDFDALANDIEALFDREKEADKKKQDLKDFYNED